MALESAAQTYLDRVRELLVETLGAELVACYVYGSALTPEFVPGRSDVDLLVVSRTWVPMAVERRMVDGLRALPRPATLKGLDLWLLPLAVARRPGEVPAFQVQMLTSWDFVRRDLPGRYGDPRLAMLLAICRNHADALVGPDPRAVIGRVPLAGILAGMLSDVNNTRASAHYRVLNACRDLHFLHIGRMCGKLQGAEWARGRLVDADLVDAAVAWQTDGAGPWLDPDQIDDLTAAVRARLHRAVQDGDVPAGCARWRDHDRPRPDGPKVTCVMPTYNRRRFVGRSIEMFLAQDYPNRQLVIVDDGEDDVADIVPADHRIQYAKLARRGSIGEKRNIAMEMGDGDVLVQWDDDDWYGPARLSRQVAPLADSRAALSAVQKSWMVDLGDGRFFRRRVQPTRLTDALAAGTIAMTADLWRRTQRYPDASKREDLTMLRRAVDAGAGVAGLGNDGVYVYVRHSANSWWFDQTPDDNRWWGEAPPPAFLSRRVLDTHLCRGGPMAVDSDVLN